MMHSTVRYIFDDRIIFDNFLILASDYRDALSKVEMVLHRCQKHGFVLKMKKSWISTHVVTFFGYEVYPGPWQLSADACKAAILFMIFPITQKVIQNFPEAANFFHTHIVNFAS